MNVPLNIAALSDNEIDRWLIETEHKTNGSGSPLPELVIKDNDPTGAAKQLAKFIAAHGKFLSNGYAPVEIVVDSNGMPRAIEVTAEAVRVHGHEICNPVKKRVMGPSAPGSARTSPDFICSDCLKTGGFARSRG